MPTASSLSPQRDGAVVLPWPRMHMLPEAGITMMQVEARHRDSRRVQGQRVPRKQKMQS